MIEWGEDVPTSTDEQIAGIASIIERDHAAAGTTPPETTGA